MDGPYQWEERYLFLKTRNSLIGIQDLENALSPISWLTFFACPSLGSRSIFLSSFIRFFQNHVIPRTLSSELRSHLGDQNSRNFLERMANVMKIVCLRLPFHGRYDELGFLRRQPGFDVRYLQPQHYRGDADVLVLAGSGKTIADLQYLRSHGGQEIVRLHHSLGKFFLGICGGFQMLGGNLFDPNCGQGDVEHAEGFGILPVDTFFGPSMMQCKTTGSVQVGAGYGGMVQGIEVRSGISIRRPEALSLPSFLRVVNRQYLLSAAAPASAQQVVAAPAGQVLRVDGRELLWAPGTEETDGCFTESGRALGTYAHAVFNEERDPSQPASWSNAAAVSSLCSLLRGSAAIEIS
jgi:cobyric acid synthase